LSSKLEISKKWSLLLLPFWKRAVWLDRSPDPSASHNETDPTTSPSAVKECKPLRAPPPASSPHESLFDSPHYHRAHRPLPCRSYRGSTPSRSASPVTIAPRFLSCLRIKCPVTRTPARLDSRPVANGYLGRLLTYKTTRPCQATTNG